MDRITQSMLDAFQNDFSLSFNDSALLFEYFSNYCVVNNIYGTNDFDLDEITTGKSTQFSNYKFREYFISCKKRKL